MSNITNFFLLAMVALSIAFALSTTDNIQVYIENTASVLEEVAIIDEDTQIVELPTIIEEVRLGSSARQVEIPKEKESVEPAIPKEDQSEPEPLASIQRSGPIQIQQKQNIIPIQESVPAIVQNENLMSPNEINELARGATVNVFCTSKIGGSFQPLSGSGVFIDDKGVILTNAHIAQYFLLKDYLMKDFMNCVIRTGSPARNTYRAELLFMPPLWIENNYKNISEQTPKGSGEHDYALLLVTESALVREPLPEKFPALELMKNIETLEEGLPILTASYPAGFIDNLSITKNLWLTSSTANIADFHVFREKIVNIPDAFSMKGLISAQEGSSGGAVVSLRDGRLLGIITTRSSGDTTGERNLYAILLEHINESMKTQIGVTLENFLKEDLIRLTKEFNTFVAPQLTDILIGELEK